MPLEFLRGITMTLTARLSQATALLAFAFIGAIVLGVF